MVRRAAFVAASLCLAWSGAAAQPAEPLLPVTPQPLHVAQGQAAPVGIDAATVIVAAKKDHGASAAARELHDLVLKSRGLDLRIQPAGGAKAIRFVRQRGQPAEGYSLTVGQAGVRVVASDDAGLLYGAATLWQLITAQPGTGAAELAPLSITDAPRFPWRGLMIDSARHFQSVGEIERVLDAMAAHKLNRFHWHLTDDQGWRIEIKKYPKLTEVGAWRTPVAGSPDGTARYGGFYSQADIRGIVAYAAARQITIVPEIEMPGHAVSAILAYPELGSGAPPSAWAQASWGGFPNVYDTGDRTLGFLKDVLTEVMAMFPGPYIHVGGDEVFKERWNMAGSADPAAQQQALTHRIAEFLEAHHRRLVGWDEILQGGPMPPDAVVTSWHGVDGGIAAAKLGHDAVLAPAPVMYFDNRQGLGREAPWGRGWLVRLEDAYRFDPLPPTIPSEAQPHILGLQANVWTEHVRTDEQLEALTFPRIVAVAENAWSAPGRKDWASFARALPTELARLESLGLRPDRAAVRVVASPTATGSVALAAQLPGEIRYTTDGSDPTPASPVYTEPLQPGRLKAALFVNAQRAGPLLDRTGDSFSTRVSQELKLCDEKLTLNLEGADHRTYFINPVNACWTWVAADMAQTRHVTISFARLPFNLGLDAAHNTTLVHPPRTPAGEIEVRPDTCLADPLALVSIPPGRVGERGEVTLTMPPRTGRHDLCITVTNAAYDPFIALDEVRLSP